ncbi:MAG: tRNA (adenosine(37)-N6)-threonylcarbamoyltransferase complex transferase subunit TsaD [bacterium]|nr:tRNA (adenosine(37)-N6)-threonylcarbamoyltransferase complex transferase subunit TsaD [bacterium]
MQRTSRTLRVLGIESSCDETAAAVVTVAASRRDFSFSVRSSVVASQVALHAKTGGIVPEVAAREHVGAIMPVIEQALRDSGGRRSLAASIDAIAVTAGPGLMTSLAVGVEAARSLAYAWGKPVIGVNHIEGHVLSALLPSVRHFDHVSPRARGENRRIRRLEKSATKDIATGRDLSTALEMTRVAGFPALALVVSGGHTELLLMRTWRKYELVGATRDDAAGEAFDKVAKLLGLPYPGGPAVSQCAASGNPAAFSFPRPMLDSDDFDFSFSGLKTAVRYALARIQPQAAYDQQLIADVCASFQQAAVEVLVAKTVRAARSVGAKTILLGGGVAANRELRQQLDAAVRAQCPDVPLLIPHASYTGDNAVMIAAAGGVRMLIGKETGWKKLAADANWELGR